MAQPSPRPWRVEGVMILDADDNIVAVCRQAKPSNTMIALANAELIAAALADRAELLAACKASLELIDFVDGSGGNVLTHGEGKAKHDDIKRAIAKAESRS